MESKETIQKQNEEITLKKTEDIILKENEEIRTHPEYPDYGITNQGRIYSYKKKDWMTIQKQQQGYHQVSLKNANGKQTTTTVSRLVLLAFDKMQNFQADHINNSHTKEEDDHIENLQWLTRDQNIQKREADKYKKLYLQTKGEANSLKKKHTELQEEYDQLLQLFAQFNLVKDPDINPNPNPNPIIKKSVSIDSEEESEQEGQQQKKQ